MILSIRIDHADIVCLALFRLNVRTIRILFLSHFHPYLAVCNAGKLNQSRQRQALGPRPTSYTCKPNQHCSGEWIDRRTVFCSILIKANAVTVWNVESSGLVTTGRSLPA